jgi:hypothetical protein
MENNQNEQNLESSKPSKLRKVGITLIISSFILYGGLLIVPLTPFSTSGKLTFSSILVVMGEITFWIGGIILGREVVGRYRKFLNPVNWYKRKRKPNNQ